MFFSLTVMDLRFISPLKASAVISVTSLPICIVEMDGLLLKVDESIRVMSDALALAAGIRRTAATIRAIHTFHLTPILFFS